MFISNILKQNRANKELQDRLKQNIESTATLLRAVDSENQNTQAIENYEEVNKVKKEDRMNTETQVVRASSIFISQYFVARNVANQCIYDRRHRHTHHSFVNS